MTIQFQEESGDNSTVPQNVIVPDGSVTENGLVDLVTGFEDSYGTPGVKRYVALLAQSGITAPGATVLENSLSGPIVWSYLGVGSYLGTLAGAFTANKTGQASGVVPVDGILWSIVRQDANTVLLACYSPGGDATELSTTIYVELPIYP